MIATMGQAEDFTITGSLGQGFAVEYRDAEGRALYTVTSFASYNGAFAHARRTFAPAETR